MSGTFHPSAGGVSDAPYANFNELKISFKETFVRSLAPSRIFNKLIGWNFALARQFYLIQEIEKMLIPRSALTFVKATPKPIRLGGFVRATGDGV